VRDFSILTRALPNFLAPAPSAGNPEGAKPTAKAYRRFFFGARIHRETRGGKMHLTSPVHGAFVMLLTINWNVLQIKK